MSSARAAAKVRGAGSGASGSFGSARQGEPKASDRKHQRSGWPSRAGAARPSRHRQQRARGPSQARLAQRNQNRRAKQSHAAREPLASQAVRSLPSARRSTRLGSTRLGCALRARGLAVSTCSREIERRVRVQSFRKQGQPKVRQHAPQPPTRPPRRSPARRKGIAGTARAQGRRGEGRHKGKAARPILQVLARLELGLENAVSLRQPPRCQGRRNFIFQRRAQGMARQDAAAQVLEPPLGCAAGLKTRGPRRRARRW